MTRMPFDPDSPGARRLASVWAPQLERWEMRVPAGHHFRRGDGGVVHAGQTMEVGAPAGRVLLERGYKLVRSYQIGRSR